MSTIVTVEGNLTGDPVLRTVPAREANAGERQVANLRIAVSDRVRDEGGEWVNTEALYYDVALWGPAAAHATRLSTGDRVVVHGDLRVGSYPSNRNRDRAAAPLPHDHRGDDRREPALRRRPGDPHRPLTDARARQTLRGRPSRTQQQPAVDRAPRKLVRASVGRPRRGRAGHRGAG